MGKIGSGGRPRSRARVFLGLALVVASVLGVLAVVATSRQTTRVYVARHPLVAGETLTPSDLLAKPVHLGGTTARYLEQGSLPDKLVVRRDVAAGELVPASALGAESGASQARVVVRVQGIPETVVVGAPVALWSAQKPRAGATAEPPAVLARHAHVVRVIEGGALTSPGGGGDAVELRIPGSRTSAVLQAQAADEMLSIVPSGTSLAKAP